MQKNRPSLRFTEFSDDWCQYKLGEVADIVGGGTPNTSVAEYWGGNIDWYSPFEISGQTYVNKSRQKITKLGFKKSSTHFLPIGTVLFTSRAGIGKTAILAREGTTNQGFQSIVPHTNLNSYFLFSLTHKLKHYGERYGAGSTFIEISGQQMAKMPLTLPSIHEQNKVGNFFKQLDKIITLHQQKLTKLKELKQGYLQQMFPNRRANIPELRFKNFAETWKTYKIGDCTKYRRGSFPQPYGNKQWYDGPDSKPFVQVVDVTDHLTLVNQTKQQISTLAQPKSVFVKKGTVIVTLQGSIGRVAITQYNSYVDRTLLIFESYFNQTDLLFWAYTIQKIFNIERQKAPGGTIKTITKDALSSFNISLTSYDEQEKIGSFFKQLDQRIALQQRKLDSLKELKKGFLQKMFV